MILRAPCAPFHPGAPFPFPIRSSAPRGKDFLSRRAAPSRADRTWNFSLSLPLVDKKLPDLITGDTTDSVSPSPLAPGLPRSLTPLFDIPGRTLDGDSAASRGETDATRSSSDNPTDPGEKSDRSPGRRICSAKFDGDRAVWRRYKLARGLHRLRAFKAVRVSGSRVPIPMAPPFAREESFSIDGPRMCSLAGGF